MEKIGNITTKMVEPKTTANHLKVYMRPKKDGLRSKKVFVKD